MVVGSLVCRQPRWLRNSPSDPQAGSGPGPALASVPQSDPASLSLLDSPHSPPAQPRAHQGLAHGFLPLLGIGVLPLPHVDLQAPLVQDVTVLEAGERARRESVMVRRCWAGELPAQGVSLPHPPGPWHCTGLRGLGVMAGGAQALSPRD